MINSRLNPRSCSLKVLLLVAGIVLAPSATARTPAADVRADDGIRLFEAFCVRDQGNPDRALSVLGDGNAMANRLSEDLVTKLQGGRTGGLAWAVAGPNNAQLLLGYTSNGMCEVRIADADQKSVKTAFAALANASAVQAGAKVDAAAPVSRNQNGARLTYQTFSYPLAGKTAALAITTSDKRVGAQQHLMTFSFVN